MTVTQLEAAYLAHARAIVSGTAPIGVVLPVACGP
jgi:hypothetical protein